MQMVGAFAEFERAMLRERTTAGLEAARRDGRIGGRRPKLTLNSRPRSSAWFPEGVRPPPTPPDYLVCTRLRSRVCYPKNALPLISTRFLLMGEDAE
jgi:DNA invertase Pin-like site-specific DNA recombinase